MGLHSWEKRSVRIPLGTIFNGGTSKFLSELNRFPTVNIFFTYIYFEKLRHFLPKHNIFLFRTLYYVYTYLILFTIVVNYNYINAITLYIIICRIVEVYVIICSHVDIKILIDNLNELHMLKITY